MQKQDDTLDVAFDDVETLIDHFKKQASKSLDDLTKEQEGRNYSAEKKLADTKKDFARRIEEEIQDLRLQGLITSYRDASKYAESELKKRNIRDKQQQLNNLKELSKQSQKQRDKEEKTLDKKINRQKEINNLRDDVKEDGTEKSNTEKFLDNAKADFKENFSALSDGFKSSMSNLGANFMAGVAQMSNVINSTITAYANYKGAIDARLQGTTKDFSSISDDLTSISYTGLLSTQDLYNNISELVKEGIVSNLEQRALFMTLKDTIAPTFDVTSNALKNIVKVQQEDSTAARLGMESYLTKFLNEYVENTEYLTTKFDSVADSLYEASAVMKLNGKSAGESAEFEYLVQKWLGSLSGVGLSDSTISSLSQAIGQLGSGNIEALNGSAVQNLLVMGAAKANLDYASLLTNGLSNKETNDLLMGITVYLQEIAKSQSNVVKSQLAQTFGVNVSDLVAVSNLENKELNKIYSSMMTSNDMYTELGNQFSELNERLGQAKILENLFSNFQYGQGMSIANNPATYALWKITDLIQGVTGGINVPTVSVLGNSVDLNTTAENIMKLGIIGISTFKGIGDIISGLGATFSGKNLLDKLKVSSGVQVVSRGEGLDNYVTKDVYAGTYGGNSLLSSKENYYTQLTKDNEEYYTQLTRENGITTSDVTYIGNSNSSVYQNSALQDAYDSTQKEVDMKKEETKDPLVDYLDNMNFVQKFEDITTSVMSMDKRLEKGISVSVDNLGEDTFIGLSTYLSGSDMFPSSRKA